MRAALNEIASLEPKWLLKITPKEWYDKYSRKIEKMRLPEKEDQKEKYAVNVVKDGFHVLDSLKNHDAPKSLLGLSKIKASIASGSFGGATTRTAIPSKGSKVSFVLG